MRANLLFPVLVMAMLSSLYGCSGDSPKQENAVKTTKVERNSIAGGNEAFREGNFRKALDLYDDALASSPASEAAQFNKAVALMKLSGGNDSTMIADASTLYDALGQSAYDVSIKEKANYNLGNLAFNAGDYDRSIEYYKRALRINPANMITRENLRVAQLKRKKDDKNQNQQQDQQQQQQQQDQQQDQQQQQQDQQQQQQQQQPDADADQILQSMQNRENQTREQAEKKPSSPSRNYSDKPW